MVLPFWERALRRERFREKRRFGEVCFGPVGVKVLMGDLSGEIFKLLSVDSAKERRARNSHLDQWVYRWAPRQGYVEVDAEIVWDEKTTVGLLPISKYRKKDKEPLKKNGRKWQEKRAENQWGRMFQYPREGRISRSLVSNVKQHTEMSNKANGVGAKPVFPQLLPVYAARFPTSKTCISLILDFLWFPEPALSMDMGGWKCQGIKAYHSPSNSLQLMIDRSWCTTTPAPLPLEWCNSEMRVLRYFPEFPGTGLRSVCP